MYDGMESVRANPRFKYAIRASSVPSQDMTLANKEPWFAKYIGDLANSILECAALYFHLQLTRYGEGNGATLGKLQRLAFVHGFASPRRVTMYVKRMVQIGRLSYAKEEGDRRVRRLIPSPALSETARSGFILLCQGADVIWPGLDVAKRLADDEEFFQELIVEAGEIYVLGADPVRPFGDVRHFTSKDAGTFLLNTMITESMGAGAGISAKTNFSINYSEIARRCGVSRTHVRNVLESAAARGLLEFSADGGRSVRFTDKFIESFERYFACLLIFATEAAKKAAENLDS